MLENMMSEERDAATVSLKGGYDRAESKFDQSRKDCDAANKALSRARLEQAKAEGDGSHRLGPDDCSGGCRRMERSCAEAERVRREAAEKLAKDWVSYVAAAKRLRVYSGLALGKPSFICGCPDFLTRRYCICGYSLPPARSAQAAVKN